MIWFYLIILFLIIGCLPGKDIYKIKIQDLVRFQEKHPAKEILRTLYALSEGLLQIDRIILKFTTTKTAVIIAEIGHYSII